MSTGADCRLARVRLVPRGGGVVSAEGTSCVATFGRSTTFALGGRGRSNGICHLVSGAEVEDTMDSVVKEGEGEGEGDGENEADAADNDEDEEDDAGADCGPGRSGRSFSGKSERISAIICNSSMVRSGRPSMKTSLQASPHAHTRPFEPVTYLQGLPHAHVICQYTTTGALWGLSHVI